MSPVDRGFAVKPERKGIGILFTQKETNQRAIEDGGRVIGLL